MKKGFTLVELVVVVGIITLLGGLILANTGQFNSRSQITIAAQNVGSAMRKAQTFGSGVRQAAPGIFPGYGVHIDRGGNSIIIFADTYPGSPNRVYDSGNDILLETIILEGGITVSDICAIGSQTRCNRASVDVVFLRPDPTIFITSPGVSNITNTYITLSAPRFNLTKLVRVWITGQIAIE